MQELKRYDPYTSDELDLAMIDLEELTGPSDGT